MPTKFSGPSAKTLEERLGFSEVEARLFKQMMNREKQVLPAAEALGVKLRLGSETPVYEVLLQIADKIMDGNGLGYLESAQDTYHQAYGIEYVNMGDTYKPTLMFDLEKGKFIAGDWGTQVETQPRRFGE